eukprot:scaffold15072_cov68-Phaeocystis_antarctica.AAC.4
MPGACMGEGAGEGGPGLVEGARGGAQGGHAEGASSSKAASSPKRVESWPLHTCSRRATTSFSHAPSAASLAALMMAAAIAPIARCASLLSAMSALQRYAPAALASLTSSSRPRHAATLRCRGLVARTHAAKLVGARVERASLEQRLRGLGSGVRPSSEARAPLTLTALARAPSPGPNLRVAQPQWLDLGSVAKHRVAAQHRRLAGRLLLRRSRHWVRDHLVTEHTVDGDGITPLLQRRKALEQRLHALHRARKVRAVDAHVVGR